MGRDKVEVKLKKLSFYIELGDYKKASELLSQISEAIPTYSSEEVRKIQEFLDFYSKRIKQLEERLGLKISNKSKVSKSYLK